VTVRVLIQTPIENDPIYMKSLI